MNTDKISFVAWFNHGIDRLFNATVVYIEMQAQLVSAVRTAISTASGPLLLEAGLELATKVSTENKFLFYPFRVLHTTNIDYRFWLINIYTWQNQVMTSSITGGDRVALNRLFLLISRPLSDIEDLFYPSFADWVVCKVFQFSYIVLCSDISHPILFWISTAAHSFWWRLCNLTDQSAPSYCPCCSKMLHLSILEGERKCSWRTPAIGTFTGK